MSKIALSSEEKNAENDLAKYVGWIKKSRNHWSTWRDEARECYKYYSGEQWTDQDKQYLKSENRQAVTFNRTTRTINAVVGMEVQNRQSVVYHPRGVEDGGLTDLATQAAKWVRDNCDAEDEESESFADTLICGIGWTSTRMDYEMVPEGQVIIERIDPFEMGVDPSSNKRNFDDSKYRFRIKKYSRAEFEERFPGKDWAGGGTFGFGDDGDKTHENTRDKYTREIGQIEESEIEVAQLQYYELEYVYFVEDQAGVMSEVPPKVIERVRAIAPLQGWKVSEEKRPKRKYEEVFLTPHEILEENELKCGSFTFSAITGLRDRNENTWFGLVRLMKDPQMWANKWLSQILHILNSQAKSGKLLYEAGAFTNPKRAATEWAKPNTMIEMTPGALGSGKIQQLQAMSFPPGMEMLLQYAVQAINDTPGVSTEMLGLANRNQAGVLEESRKQAGITVLAVFFDSLRRYRKEQGRVLLAYIRDYISDGRLIRISNGLGSQYTPLLRDKMSEQYDIVVDDAPSAPNQQEKTYKILAEMLPQLMQAGVPVPPELIDYAPLPSELKVKWRQHIEKSKQNPQAEAMAQMEMEKAKAEIASQLAKAKLDEAKAATEMASLNSDTSQAENAKATQEAMLRLNEMSIQAKMKMEEIDANERIRREELNSKLSFEREKASAELMTKLQIEQQRMELEALLKNKEIDTRVNEQEQNKGAVDIESALARALQPIEQKLQTKQVTVVRTPNGLEGQISVG